MTIKTSRIEDIVNIREKTNQYGVTYYYDMLLENGDRGSIGKKSPDALRVGQQFTYTAEEGPFGLRFSEPKEPFQAGGQNGGGWKAPNVPQKVYNGGGSHVGEDRNRSFALAYAKDLVAALAPGAGATTDQATAATLKMADRFLEWLNNK